MSGTRSTDSRSVLKHSDMVTTIDESSATANMYGCEPCPQCGSRYRWCSQVLEVTCDDCGLVQKAVEKTKVQP